MIYPQHVFVALAGLSLTSAAPVRHTANATSAHHALLAPGHAAPLSYVQKIKESDYPDQCWESWKMFNEDKCWCFTGCALDCSQGGAAGVAGTTTNPEWCTTVTDHDKKSCEEIVCDLVANCDEVADDLTPGLDKIVSTGGYTCGAADAGTNANPGDPGAPMDYWIDKASFGGFYLNVDGDCPLQPPEDYSYDRDRTGGKGKKFDLLIDGNVIATDLPPVREVMKDFLHRAGKGCLFQVGMEFDTLVSNEHWIVPAYGPGWLTDMEKGEEFMKHLKIVKRDE